MRELLKSFRVGFVLVNENFSIFFLALVFAWLPDFYTKYGIHGFVKLALILLSLGWLGTKFVLLYRAYTDKKVSWKDFWKNLMLYTRKLLPAVVLLAVLGLIPFLLMVGLFVRWFLGEYFGGEVGVVQGQLIDQIVLAVNNPNLWGEFVSQNGWLVVLSQAFGLLILIGVLMVKLFLSVMVVEETTVWQSMRVVGNFIQSNLMLLVMFLLLRVGANALVMLAGILPNLLSAGPAGLEALSGTIPILEGTPWEIMIGVLGVYLGLIIDAFVLVYYAEHREQKGLVSRVKRLVKRKN